MKGGRRMTVKRPIKPTGILSHAQLLAAMAGLLLVVVPALVTGAVTVSSPAWAPGIFALTALAYVPVVVLIFT